MTCVTLKIVHLPQFYSFYLVIVCLLGIKNCYSCRNMNRDWAEQNKPMFNPSITHISLVYSDGTSKSPRHLVADTGTKSRGIENWEVTVFIQKKLSGVCYLSAEKHHTPLLFYSFWIVLNIILSFNLKPFLCEHVKSVNFVQYIHINMYRMFGTKSKPSQKCFSCGFIFQNLLPTLSLLIKLLL